MSRSRKASKNATFARETAFSRCFTAPLYPRRPQTPSHRTSRPNHSVAQRAVPESVPENTCLQRRIAAVFRRSARGALCCKTSLRDDSPAQRERNLSQRKHPAATRRVAASYGSEPRYRPSSNTSRSSHRTSIRDNTALQNVTSQPFTGAARPGPQSVPERRRRISSRSRAASSRSTTPEARRCFTRPRISSRRSKSWARRKGLLSAA